MSRKITITVCVFVGLAACSASVKAGPLTTLGLVYNGASDFQVVQPDSLWHPVDASPTVHATAKYATGNNYVISTTNSSGGAINMIAGVQGSGTSPSTTGYNQGTNKFFSAGGGFVNFNPSDPFAWRVTAYTGSTANNQTYNPLFAGSSYSSLTQSPNYMVAYRKSDWEAGRYVLMWDTDGTLDNYNSLVVEVFGVQNPEPASMTLMGLGLVGLVGYGVRCVRRRKAAVTAETPIVAA